MRVTVAPRNPKTLLLESQPLVIIPELAVAIGLNEAIILQQIHYWVQLNEKVNRNFRDGYYWTYNSFEQWREQFQFWGLNTIKRAIATLESNGIVVSGNFNDMKTDRTKWYRIDYDKLYGLIAPSSETPNSATAEPRNGASTQIGTMHRPTEKPRHDASAQFGSMESPNLVQCNGPSWADGKSQSGTMQEPTLGRPLPETYSESSPEKIQQDEAAYACAREGEAISSGPTQALGGEALAASRKPRFLKRIRITRTHTQAHAESVSSGDLSDARENRGQEDLWRAVDQGQAPLSEHDSFGELAATAEAHAGSDLRPQDKPSPDQSSEPEGMAKLEDLAIGLLQRAMLTGDELHMIAELLEQGVPVATMMRGIQESFEAFVPRYTGDRIKRLTYCRDRIIELHEAATRPRSSPSPQRTTRKFGRISRESETPLALVQPGKYDKMNELLERLVQKE